MDEKTFKTEVAQMPGWPKLSAEAQDLVTANYLYYDKGIFPSPELVPMTPPTLVRRPGHTGDQS